MAPDGYDLVRGQSGICDDRERSIREPLPQHPIEFIDLCLLEFPCT